MNERELCGNKERYAISDLKNGGGKKGISVSAPLKTASVIIAALFLAAVLFLGMGGALSRGAASDGLGPVASLLIKRATAFGFFISGGGYFPYGESESEAEETDDRDCYTNGDGDCFSETEAQTESEKVFEDVSEETTEENFEDTSELTTEKNSEDNGDALAPDVPKNALLVTALNMCEEEREYGDLIDDTDGDFDVSELLDSDLNGFYIEGSRYPLVLVIHTHTSESYSENGYYYLPDGEKNMLRGVAGIGDRVVNSMIKKGIPAVHFSVIHDENGGVDSLERAEETIKAALEMYPSVKYVIDLRRTAETDGEGMMVAAKTGGFAQIRLTVASADSSRTERNLSLALKLRREMNSEKEDLCRPVAVSRYEYNSRHSHYYLTVDVGSCGNTYEEAERAADIFAEAFAEVLRL